MTPRIEMRAGERMRMTNTYREANTKLQDEVFGSFVRVSDDGSRIFVRREGQKLVRSYPYAAWRRVHTTVNKVPSTAKVTTAKAAAR